MEVAMVYRGESPHPAHKGFAEAIGADLLDLNRYPLIVNRLRHSIPEELMNGVLLPNYDVYLTEGTRALYGSLAKQVLSNSPHIYLAGDQALYKLTDESYMIESQLNRLISTYGMRALRKLFNAHIDGVIAVSDFSASYTKRILPNKPYRVAHPYIQPELYDILGAVEPSLRRNTAITVGAFAGYKGQDILAECWSQVREGHPDAQLNLVGSDYPEELGELPGITVLGYVDDLTDALSDASLYVQPSRVDNFPVSVLEAMRAGLPAIVTSTTGNKSEVQKLGDEMVTEAKAGPMARSICKYFDMSYLERQTLSTSAREIGSRFDSKSRRNIFRNEFNDLLSEISS